MKPSDRAAFAECMAPFASVYGLQLTPLVLDVWWGALAEFHLDDVKTALALHVKDPEAGMYRPTPAHIINHLTHTIPESRREARNRLQREYLALRNTIEAKQYMVANDRKLGLLKDDEYQRLMYELAQEMSALNALPRFEPLLSQLPRGY